MYLYPKLIEPRGIDGSNIADVAEIVAEVVVRDLAGTIAHHGSDGGACCSSTSSACNLTEPCNIPFIDSLMMNIIV